MAYISNAERREQFIQAATRVIREHGIGAATTRRIAEAAEAPLGSLHYCFRGKDELYESVMRTLGWEGMARIRSVVTSDMGVANAVAAMLRALASWTLESYDNHLIEYEVFIWAIRSKKFSHIPADAYGDWITLISGLLNTARREDEPEYDFEAITRMMMAFVDGYSLQDQYLSEELICEHFESAIKVIVRGIDAGDFVPRRTRRRKRNASL